MAKTPGMPMPDIPNDTMPAGGMGAKPAKPKMPKTQQVAKPFKPPKVPGIKGPVKQKLGNHFPNT